MQNEVAIIIDNYLLHLKSVPGGSDIFQVQNRSDNTGQEAIRLMYQHNLISQRNPGNRNSIIDITSEGILVIDNGGFAKFIGKAEVKKQNKQALEEEKLKYDVINAKRIFRTYWWTFGAAITALLISLFNLYKSIKGH
ncbi:hypothetical protein ABDD95_16415 [Mucilaginibacter sp. PAMB04274]|uniref:hypothetical protein n=1 Tax=Mucilaginibacter sp. PAMB04274 TaxID=3138568 RepID=UPI0031F71E46